MTAKLLLRIAAISLLTIVLGHSTTLIPREPRDLTETLVLKGMKTYEMNLFGSMRTYWDFHQGMSIIMTLQMAVAVSILWILANMAETHPRQVLPLATALFLGAIPFAVLCWMYFFFLPGTFATIGAVAMGLSLPKLARVS
jgi:hypothetical protein